MAILVKTPLTSNGRDPLMDHEGKIKYKETVLEDAARPIIEKANLKLPNHLKKVVSPYNAFQVPAEKLVLKPINYGVWGLKKLQGELEERGLLYDEKSDKPELVALLKNDDETKH